MNDILEKKLSARLDDWLIRSLGIVDKNTFLVVADWRHENDSEKKFKDGDDTFWTALYSIDIEKNMVPGLILDGGIGKCYLDGGCVRGIKQAVISSFNGISYFIDYSKETFEVESIIKKVSIRDIRLISGHFYLASSAAEIYQRTIPGNWELFSKESHAFWKKFRGGAAASVDGFNEKDMYFSTEKGLIWHFNGQQWSMLDSPSNAKLDNLICAEDGNVYIGGLYGELVIGKGDQFKNIITIQQAEDMGVTRMYDMAFFQGTLYASLDKGLCKLENSEWVPADLGLFNIGFLAAKDGIMLLGGNYELHIFDGKEIKTIYRNKTYLEGKFVIEKMLNISDDISRAGHRLLDTMEKGKK